MTLYSYLTRVISIIRVLTTMNKGYVVYKICEYGCVLYILYTYQLQ